MNIGVSAFAWTTHFSEKHVAILPALREHGLTHFELAMFDPASIPASSLRHAFEANDLTVSVCAILPDGTNPISEDASIRKASIGHLKRCIETTAELGAGLLCGPVYAPIGYLPGRRRNQQEWAWAVEAMQAVTPQLEASRITLAIEPVNRSETFFLNTAAEALEFCKAVDHPRVGVTIDTFHANIEEKNIAAAVVSLGSHLKHLHVSENDRGLAGSGHINFPEIIRSLKDIHYEGALMLEGFGYSADEPHSLGALWGNPEVSPEDIAFKGESYLRELCLRA